jgi:Glycopeptide antibiotics resistance protein
MLLLLFFRLSLISDMNITAARSLNLIPLHTIWGYLSGNISVPASIAMDNVFGNIVVFAPYGLYIQVIRKDKRVKISFLQILLTSAVIEIIQFSFNLGAADIDDIILNCLGGLIGIFLYRILLKLVKEQEKAKNIVTVVSLFVGLPIIYIAFSLLFRNRIRLQ